MEIAGKLCDGTAVEGPESVGDSLLVANVINVRKMK